MGIHIKQITNAHVTTIMYHFASITATPVVRIPQVIVTLVCEVVSTYVHIIIKELSAYIHLLHSGNTLYTLCCGLE